MWNPFRKKQPEPSTEPFKEAAGFTVDADEDEWRRLSGDNSRDLQPLTRERMQKLAVYLWESNVLANRLVELPIAFLLAEGVTLQHRDDDMQQCLNRFWNDPINKMDLKLVKKARELALFGEQCWPAFVNEMNGHVRLGYLDPAQIATVVTDPDNIEQPIGVVTKKDKKGNARRFRVIINGPESVFTQRTQAIRETFDDGDCFYFTINGLSNSRRGRSDLLAQIDWLDTYDEFMFGEVDRANFMRAFIWDVTLTGADEHQVKKRARTITTPKPGSVRVHNENESWKAETPSLQAGDSAEAAKLFRNHMLGGATFPEHWYGGAGDVNRATGESMGEPTYKILSMRQMTLKHMLAELAVFVLRQKALADGEREPALDSEVYDTEVIFPEMTAKDTSKYASALQQVSFAVITLVDKGLLTEEKAVQVIVSIAGRLGVELDAAEELENARVQYSKRQEADVFTDPATVGEKA